MATSTVSVSINKTGIAGNITDALPTTQYVNTSAPDNRTTQAFASATFAAVSVPTLPAAPTGVWIQPPAGNTGAITLKGVTGDTGVALHLTQPSWISLASTAAFGLLCANATVMTFEWT